MAIYQYSIMILEDSPEERGLYWSYLSQDGVATYNVIEVDTGSQALTELLKTTPDLILIKNQLPDMDVWQFRYHLESVKLEIPIIIIADNEDATLAVEAMKHGVQDYIFKSKITASGLCRAVNRVLEKTQLLKQIRIQEQQQQLLARILLRIRQFLGLAEILPTAVEEVQKFLRADRVIVYKFEPDKNGQIVAESLLNCQSFHTKKSQHHSFPEKQIINYSLEKIRAIADRENDVTKEHQIEISASCQIKAYLTVPILLNQEIWVNVAEDSENENYLWGLLIAHQCSNAREWKKQELDLLEQICVQLGVAIQQAELYENLRNININLEEKIQEKTEQLRDSERRFRAIFNNSFQFTGLLTTAGIVLEYNQTALNFARLQLEDVINRPLWETYWWQNSTKNQEQLKQAIARAAQGEFIRYEVDILGAGEQTATIDFSLYPLKDETGKVVMLIPEGRDITEKNRLERECQNVLAALQDSEAELRGLFQAMDDVIFILDQQGRYLKIAPTYAEDKLYQSSAELLGKTVREIFPSHLADFFISIIEQTLTTQQSSECEYSLKIGKKEIWFSAKVSPISTDTVIWAARDITKAKHNEIIQKNADKALQEHQLLLQVVMDTLPMAIFWKDKNSRYLGCNRQLLLDAGLSTTAEIIGKTDFDMVWREQAPLYQADDRAVMESGQPKFNIEEPLTKSGNQRRDLRTNKIPLQNPEGEIIGVLGSYEDITESKKIEQALKESERRYATLTQSAPVGIYRTDASGNCLYVNPHWCEISGLTPQEAAGNGWEKALHPNDQQLIATEWELLVTTGKIFCLEYRFRRPDGSESWVFGQAVPEKDSAGKIIGYVGTITDISSRKQAEKALRRSEQLYRTLVDNFPGGIVVLFDHDLRYLLVGGKGLNSAGLTKAEMQGKTVWEIFPPEMSERIAPVFQQTLAGETIILEIPVLDRLYLTHHIPVTDDQGNIIAGILMNQDITDRKKAEQERNRLLQMLEAQNQTLEAQVAERTAQLKQSEKRFRNLVETSSDWVWEVNEFGVYTYSSPQIIKVLGYTPEEILGKTPFDFIPKAEAEKVLQEFMKYFTVQAPFQCLENTNLHKDGREIILETSAVPIFDEDKQFRGYRGMDRDITARKQSEVALRQSEARFQRIAANLPGAIYQYVLHTDGYDEFLYMSDKCREIYELESATVLANAENIYKLTYPEDVPFLQETIILSANSLQQWSWEGRIITPSGKMKWIHGIAQPEKLDNGDILWDGLVFDISDRKQTEIALSNLSDRLNLAITSAQIGIWDWDIVNDHLVWDDRMYKLYGLKPSEFTGAYSAWEAALHPHDLPFGRTAIQQAIAGEKDFELEFRVIWPDGTIRFIKAYALVQRDHQGKAQRMIGINFDITENKQSEGKLKEAKIQLRNLSDRLKLAVTSAKIGIWDFDLVNDSLIWDEQMYKLFGISPISFNLSQGARAKFEQLLHPDDRLTLWETLQTVIAENQELDTEFRVIWPDGKIRILKTYGIVQRNSQGIPQRMIGINYDISDRRREEMENQRLKDRLEFVLSASPAIIYTCQAYGNFAATFISKNVKDILGYTTQECLENPNFWLDHIYPEDVSLVLTERSQLGNKESHGYQYRFRHQNGNYIWLEDEFRLVRDKTGQPREIIGYVVDISDEKAALHEREIAEAEIIRSRDLREAIFNESADALFLVDIETIRTTDCNQRAVEMFAANSKNDLIGIKGNQLQTQQFSDEELQAIQDEINQNGVWSREIEYKTFPGNLFWGNLAVKEIRVGGQKMNLVRVTDISQRKLAEAQLQETNKQLKASNEELAQATRLKDEFLANMSHELRTPLNAILGISEGLQDSAFGMLNEKQIQGLQTIERSGKHLLELINDILDLSKIEAGQIELHSAPTSINQVCQSSLTFIKQQAFKKQIQLEVKIKPHLPEIFVDERRIRQVLINLLNNAVKFTPEGGKITLEVTYKPAHTDTEMTSQGNSTGNCICISIKDTGIGIAQEQIQKLFQPFVQIDSALNRQYSGTGLGLALVKRLVEIHGGQVSLSSELGVGSVFTVVLPCQQVSESTAEIVNQTLSDIKSIIYQTSEKVPLILLAEDNEANIFTISNYLEVAGYNIIVANNGKEAIAMAKTQSPDLILMDIQMPEVDGLEAIKQIRLESNLVNIPIIALTALAMPGDKEKCLAAGASDYLTKPVRLKQLTGTIKKFLAVRVNLENEP